LPEKRRVTGLSEIPATAKVIEERLRPRLADGHPKPFVVGICGAQGCGKSTAAAALAANLARSGYRTATLSLDDLYLSRAERQALGRTVHPLLATRGVPGTHDTRLGNAVFESLGRPEQTDIPRFDKASDQPLPRAQWDRFAGPADIVLFEGWCVGARPQSRGALGTPVNRLEAEEDADGRWRSYVNDSLNCGYRELFQRIDYQVLLAAPSFDIVKHWRCEQEETLRAGLNAAGLSTDGLMDAGQIARFVQHYERLTRHILAEMPGRADLVIRLDEGRRPVEVI
jgi:D-glycerate 3-kinase